VIGHQGREKKPANLAAGLEAAGELAIRSGELEQE